jgi:hypothetical protein
VGVGATGTHSTPGATLRGPKAALSREVGTGATVTHGAPRAILCREAGAALTGLLLVVSVDFFLVTSYCPTKNSRVLKRNAAILQRSRRRRCSYALAVVMVSSSTSSGPVPVLRCLVLFDGTNYCDWVPRVCLHMHGLRL